MLAEAARLEADQKKGVNNVHPKAQHIDKREITNNKQLKIVCSSLKAFIMPTKKVT